MTALIIFVTGIIVYEIGMVVGNYSTLRWHNRVSDERCYHELAVLAMRDITDETYDRYCEAEAECGRLARSRDKYKRAAERYKRAVEA